MYRKDSLLELYDDIKYFNNSNCLFSSKLVRGAYYNSEYKDGHLFNKKEDTDNNYNLGIIKCNEYNTIHNIIASHNIKSITLAKDLNKDSNKFIIANLMGMNQNYMNNLNVKKATYIPYGPYKEMIPYLTRRLYENIDSIKYMYN
jgi:proline dehydrogenase